MAIRLMLADDHRMLREGLRRSLTEEGFDVIGEASDGDEAIDLADQLRPDVVLMDVTMPGCDGVEATRRISAAHPEIRVVMLTMHADQDVLRSALAAGASGYLIKDCSIDEIGETVRMACRRAARPLPRPGRLDAERGPTPRRARTASPDRVVTKREEEVLQLIADGCSTSEVAERLYISQKTVKNHLASIYQKLDARDRTQAVLQAVRMGIVRLG